MTLERGTRRGSDGKVEVGCRSRQAAWRHASSQKRRRPCGTNPSPHLAHKRVIVPPLSLLNGDSVLVALALALCQRTFEAERVRAGLNNVGAVGNAIQHRFAQPSVRDD